MPLDILAIDAGEVAWFTAALKGRRGTKTLTILAGKPGDERTIAERLMVSHSTVIATTDALTPAERPKPKPKKPWEEDGL